MKTNAWKLWNIGVVVKAIRKSIKQPMGKKNYFPTYAEFIHNI